MNQTASRRQPLVLLPAGPLGWSSHEQIVPALAETWRRIGCRLEAVHFPRPTLTPEWRRKVAREASVLILPLGSSHNDSFWVLHELRKSYSSCPPLDAPAITMIASDLTKGFRGAFDHVKCLRPSDLLVTNCTAERELVRAAFSDSINSMAIPLPVLPATLRPMSSAERRAFKRCLGLREDDFLIVYAGRISVQKNIHGLLAIFAEFRRRHPKAHLAILGSCDEFRIPHLRAKRWGRYLHEIGLLITKLRLEGSVTFTGTLDQPALSEYLGACDAHISLTLHSGEDFGYSIAQGLLAGAPTIVSRWGGGLDFVTSGGALGVPVEITRNGPRIDFRAALGHLLSLRNPSLAARMRRAAALHAQKALLPEAVGNVWRKAIAQTTREISPPSSSVRVTSEFISEYLRYRSELNRDPRHPFQFKSAANPLYRRICRLYAADAENGVARARYYLHPLYDPISGWLDDPIAPGQTFRLVRREQRELFSHFGELPYRCASESKAPWFKRLRNAGVIVKAEPPTRSG